MKKYALLISLFSILLAACGESGTTENVTQINEMGMDVVASVGDLPKCTKDNEGEQAFVKGETSARICVDGKWFATTQKSTKDTVVVDGGDISCTTKQLKDKSGVKIICNGDSIGVVYNGKDGAQGKQGEKGAQGEQGVQGEKGDTGAAGKDGTNGTNGAGCSIKELDETMVRVICGKDSTDLYVGSAPDTSSQGIAALDSEKIAISLDTVMGVSQKGPFLKGSKVTVREMSDGRTLVQTGNTFEGKIMNDNGEFKIKARMLVSQYVMLIVNGHYRNEVTGENSSSDITLFAITNVNDRNIVNVNLLTHLEYDRVIHLVTKEKMKVQVAKRQAQQEVLDMFHIDSKDFSNSEDLDIAGSSDEDGALLAFSIMFQGDRSSGDLLDLLQTVSTDIETDGVWDDAATRMNMAEWSADADSSGRLETIRTNVANWGLSLMVPNFEKYIRHFWNTEYGLKTCDADSVGVVKAASAGKRKGTKTRYICKEIGEDFRWVIASDIEKDTYGWKDSTDGVLKTGDVTGKIYVFDKLGSFNGTEGWREAESIEKQHGGCVEALYDSIRTDKVYAYYYTCRKETHTWVREVNYLIIDTQYWPDSTDGKVKWGDSVGVVDDLERICYVWDEAPQYNGWRAGNVSDCNLGLLGCTAKRGGEMRKSASGRYYSCSNNSWIEITDDVYINTYLYRCTIDGEGDKVFKEGDLVYGIEKTTTRYACENEKWRDTKTGEEKAGKACTAKLQGDIIEMPELDSAITCDNETWRASIVFDYPEDKDWTNPGLTYGELKDERDGRVYKTIKINGLTVMAENLRYADSIASPYLKGNSWCYNNDTLNCRKGGRYYTWTAAMNIDSKWQNDSPYGVEGLIKTPHQGICPDRWHIPTDEEWKTLFDGVLPVDQQALGNPEWKEATNASGFSALPIGSTNWLPDLGLEVQFWSSTENAAEYAGAWNIGSSFAQFCEYGCYDKGAGQFPVRCIKDSEE